MVGILAIFSIIVGPLLLAFGLAVLARRTGHRMGWQVTALIGCMVAMLSLWLPIDAYFGHKVRYAETLALGMGYLLPAILLVSLALKRWPETTLQKVTESSVMTNLKKINIDRTEIEVDGAMTIIQAED
jgi:hypothetical protein